MWVLSHSDVTIGLVPTWSDIRSISILWMEVPSQLPGILSLGLRAILIWLWDVFSHDQIWVHGHFDVIEGCVPTWSDIRAIAILSWWEDCFLPCQIWVLAILSSRIDVKAIAILWMELPGEVPGTLNLRLSSHSDVIEGCVPTWSDVMDKPFYHG